MITQRDEWEQQQIFTNSVSKHPFSALKEYNIPESIRDFDSDSCKKGPQLWISHWLSAAFFFLSELGKK